MFGARRYADARSAFQDIRGQVGGDDRELADLRIAESDFFLKRYAATRDALTSYLDRASRRAEARFFYLSAIRELGNEDQYVSLTRALVNDFPDSTWSEDALNNLGTYYIVSNQDELAAQAFKECFERFPGGQHAQRVAWKYGWWAYKTGNYAETVRVFEGAAASFPRSDYRPSYLYWAARAHGRLGERTTAESRMRLVYADYMNSYYGRLARKQLAQQQAAVSNAAAAEGRAVRASLSAQEPAVSPGTAANRAAHPAAPRCRPVRRRAERAAICPTRVGNLSGNRSDDGVGVSREGDLRRAITRDAPRVSAAPGRGR